MYNFIFPLIKHKHSATNTCIVEFYQMRVEKLKKLSGYQTGRHFLPKYYSKSLEEFARNIACNDIEENMREICDRLRVVLKPGVNDFQYHVSAAEGGIFEMKDIRFDLTCKPDQENINEVVFTSRFSLDFPNTLPLQEIFEAFPFHFSHAKVNLPQSIELKSFIEQLENYNAENQFDFQYYYDPSINFLQITSISHDRKIIMYGDHFEVFFSNDFTIQDFLKNIQSQTG